VAALSAAAIPAVASTTAGAPAVSPTATPSTAKSAAAPSQQSGFYTYIDGFFSECTIDGTIYKVNANGINIRSYPDGPAQYSIGINRYFDSSWKYSAYGSVPYTCATVYTYGGQYWIYGFANYATGEQGWVGANYLSYLEPIT
jgi:hypothetical protein